MDWTVFQSDWLKYIRYQRDDCCAKIVSKKEKWYNVLKDVKIRMEKYVQSLINTPDPILPSQQPQIKLNLRGLMEYAKSIGKKVSELTEEEKNRFISKNQE
ncbi:MAG: hypothetical protein IKB70_13495 [Bacilli bacterium]|nr:hypothetical protein [Bacilli bacterium]